MVAATHVTVRLIQFDEVSEPAGAERAPSGVALWGEVARIRGRRVYHRAPVPPTPSSSSSPMRGEQATVPRVLLGVGPRGSNP